jgi:hypothetical protein
LNDRIIHEWMNDDFAGMRKEKAVAYNPGTIQAFTCRVSGKPRKS